MLNWGEIVPNSPCLAVCNEKMVEQMYLCFLGSPSRIWLVINSCFLLKCFLLASLSSLMSLQTLLPLNFHKVGDFTGWPQLALLVSRAAWVWAGTRRGATTHRLSCGIADVPRCLWHSGFLVRALWRPPDSEGKQGKFASPCKAQHRHFHSHSHHCLPLCFHW